MTICVICKTGQFKAGKTIGTLQAVEAPQSHAFVSAFLRHWGESAERKPRRGTFSRR